MKTWQKYLDSWQTQGDFCYQGPSVLEQLEEADMLTPEMQV